MSLIDDEYAELGGEAGFSGQLTMGELVSSRKTTPAQVAATVDERIRLAISSLRS